jgi:NAD(P)H-dependent FMN reductase
VNKQILLVSGSLRPRSTNTAALQTAQKIAPQGIAAIFYTGLGQLPHFNPDDDFEPLPLQVVELRKSIEGSHAVLFSTPEYAGNLPGSLKNLLDWTVGGSQMYGKPVGWINVAAPPRGAGAYAALQTVLGYVGAQPVEAGCVNIPIAQSAIGPDGLVHDLDLQGQIVQVLRAMV